MVKESVEAFYALPLQITQVRCAIVPCLKGVCSSLRRLAFRMQQKIDVQTLQGITYQRYLYLRKHEAEAAKGSGIFVAGVPFFHQDTKGILQELFEGFGPVRDVVIHPSKV